jgi:DNA-binding GntR family transcriptional regulator
MRGMEFKFHGTFIGAYDNVEISAITARLQRKMVLLRLLNAESVSTGSTVQAMREHLAIIDALEHKNADLAADGPARHTRAGYSPDPGLGGGR